MISLPPLRERREDIPGLVRFFLSKHAAELGVQNPSIQPEAVEFLRGQDWPGNVRELENVIRKVLLQAQGYTINLDHVQTSLTRFSAAVDVSAQTLRQYVDSLLGAAQRGELDDACARLQAAAERELFSRAIELANGNQAKAARWIGVSRLTMREKLIQFGFHPNRDASQVP